MREGYTRPIVVLFVLVSGCVDLGTTEELGTTEQAVSVVWTNAVGVSTAGNNLTKTGAPPWNAGASSIGAIAGNGYVELTTAENTTAKMVGLSNGDTNQSYTDIDFALHLKANGQIGVYEDGVLRGANFGTYVAGDLFRVEASGGGVTYKKNGVTFYTSTATPTFPLIVDTSLLTTGATINGVALVSTAITWSNPIGVSTAGASLIKTSAPPWNAGASSFETITGDGYVEFTSAESTTSKMAGLSHGDLNQSYADIDFAIHLRTDGRIGVYEDGVLRGAPLGTYVAGDLFRVSVTSGVVTYSKNGVTFYTSAATPTFPLAVDTSLLTTGATITGVTLPDGLADSCPAYRGGGMVCTGTFVVNNSFDLAQVAGCVRITGDLQVAGYGLTDVELPVLERVDGTVTLSSTTLVRVAFPQLREVDLGLQDNLPLVELALPRLRTVTGTVGIFGVPNEPLPCLARVGNIGNSERTDVPRLVSVDGLARGTLRAPALTSVGGVLEYARGDDLPALASVGGLVLSDADDIALPALTVIHGSAELCPALSVTETVLELPSLTAVGSFHLCPWDALTEVLLPSLRQVAGPSALGGLVLGTASTIASIDFPVLESVVGKVDVSMSSTLRALTSLSGDLLLHPGSTVTAPILPSVGGRVYADGALSATSLTTITKSLQVRNTALLPALTTVGGDLIGYVALSLPVLDAIGGRLTLSRVPAADLGSLRSIGGDVFMTRGGNGDLDLTSLQTVGGVMYIRVNSHPALSFPALSSVGGYFYASNNAAAVISAPQVTSIGGTLTIASDSLLTNIAFGALSTLGGDLYITGDPQLPTCQATNLATQLQTAGWAGTAFISGNGPGTCP